MQNNELKTIKFKKPLLQRINDWLTKENFLKLFIIAVLLTSLYREVEFKYIFDTYPETYCMNKIYGDMFKRNYTDQGIALPLEYDYTPLNNNTTSVAFNLTNLTE